MAGAHRGGSLTALALTIIFLCCIAATAKTSANRVYRAKMIRRDSPLSPLGEGRHLSRSERMMRSIQRSKQRLSHLQRLTARPFDGANYYTIVTAATAEFVTQIGVGFPHPVLQHLIVDTGSDLTWMQCKPCGKHRIPVTDRTYNPAKSKGYRNVSCTSFTCQATGYPSCDAQANCLYQYSYNDGSFTAGNVASETFSFKRIATRRWASHRPGVVFGCSHAQAGSFTASGVLGLGRGPLSLISQLGSTVNNVFSYCLGAVNKPAAFSTLFFGKVALYSSHRAQSTPILRSGPIPSYHYISLVGILVEGQPVDFPTSAVQLHPDGTGGTIIDSGSTLTALASAAFEPFLDAVSSRIKARSVNVSESIGLELCFKNTTKLGRLPSTAFVFEGGAVFGLPPENTFFHVEEPKTGMGLICLAFVRTTEENQLSIFGNLQQQNYHIVYDLETSMLSFARTRCTHV